MKLTKQLQVFIETTRRDHVDLSSHDVECRRSVAVAEFNAAEETVQRLTAELSAAKRRREWSEAKIKGLDQAVSGR
jgi:hypothetical protein